jgi:hypothetical protein
MDDGDFDDEELLEMMFESPEFFMESINRMADEIVRVQAKRNGRRRKKKRGNSNRRK